MTIQQARRTAKLTFRRCVRNGVLDEPLARRVIETILASKPRGYVMVLGQFKHLLKLQFDRQSATVETAVPLSPAWLARVREDIESAYGPNIATTFSQDPSLIGGLRIQVGFDVYDGSVRSRLSALKTSFGITPGIAGPGQI